MGQDLGNTEGHEKRRAVLKSAEVPPASLTPGCTVGTLVSLKAGQACHPVLLGAITAAGWAAASLCSTSASPSLGLAPGNLDGLWDSVMTQGCHSPCHLRSLSHTRFCNHQLAGHQKDLREALQVTKGKCSWSHS